LEHQGVDVDQGGLEQVEREDGEFLLVAAVAGELAALAEEDDVVDVMPAFDDVQAGVDLALQVAVA
jgi:metallophosphoesterase superfamily enzyme